MKNNTRLFFNLILLSLFASHSSLSHSRDSLTIGVSQYPSSLHPIFASGNTINHYIRGFTLRNTVGYDPDWKLTCFLCVEVPTIQNGMAELFERSNSESNQRGIVVSFQLRDDLFWGDGHPVTTEDVAFWFRVINAGHIQTNHHLSYYQQIEKIEVLDKYRFDVYVLGVSYKYNDYFVPNVLPRHIEEPIFLRDPNQYHLNSAYMTDPLQPGLYNGPYLVHELKAGEFVRLKENPYWQGVKPYFTELNIKTIPDTQMLKSSLLSNDVDYVAGELGLTIDQALTVKQFFSSRFDIHFHPTVVYEKIDMQLENVHLQDKRVRKALVYGLDREALIKGVYKNQLKVADSMVSPRDRVYSPHVHQYHYSPTKARQLLKQAGYKMVDGYQTKNGQVLSLEFITSQGNKSRELVQQFAQSQWKRIGVKITISNQTARVFLGENLTKRRFTGLSMYSMRTTPEFLPSAMLHSSYIPSAINQWSGRNYSGFRNKGVDQRIVALEQTLNEEKRIKLWAELQSIYTDQLPSIPLFFRSDTFVTPKWLSGVKPTGHKNSSSYWAEHWHRTSEEH